MNQTLSVTVKGKRHTWAFNFKGDPQYIAEWTADGLEVVEVVNSVPAWAVRLGLLRSWVRVQDAWRWLRVW
jgi:hypothetical protein